MTVASNRQPGLLRTTLPPAVAMVRPKPVSKSQPRNAVPKPLPLPRVTRKSDRPVMLGLIRDQRGVDLHQINCASSELVEVYIERTGVDVWIPFKCFQNVEFILDFSSQPVTRATALAFSRVNSLGYHDIPLPDYLPGLERFLDRLQHGKRTIAHLFCGQCPHKECPRFINNQDTGHYCLAMAGAFTDHHVGRDTLIKRGLIQP